jgi:hypothetical protein
MIVDLIQVPPIERIDSPTGRLYRTPEGNLYPSVSTILSKGMDHSYIDAWKEKVGEEVAAKISKKATDRGTLLHENIENRILGKPETFNMFHVEEKQMFKSALPVVDGLTRVIALETQLWSDKLRSAGTVDCCAEYNGKLRLIDWKTSGHIKSRDEIHSYFLQASAYAYMIYERTGIAVGDILIVMLTQDDGLLLFEEKVKDWLPEYIKLRNSVEL